MINVTLFVFSQRHEAHKSKLCDLCVPIAIGIVGNLKQRLKWQLPGTTLKK